MRVKTMIVVAGNFILVKPTEGIRRFSAKQKGVMIKSVFDRLSTFAS